jgi:hypothetical protein
MSLWNVYNVRIRLSSSVSVLYIETAELSMHSLIICYSRIPTKYISKSSYYGRKRRYPQNDTRKVWKVIRSHTSRIVSFRNHQMYWKNFLHQFWNIFLIFSTYLYTVRRVLATTDGRHDPWNKIELSLPLLIIFCLIAF